MRQPQHSWLQTRQRLLRRAASSLGFTALVAFVGMKPPQPWSRRADSRSTCRHLWSGAPSARRTVVPVFVIAAIATALLACSSEDDAGAGSGGAGSSAGSGGATGGSGGSATGGAGACGLCSKLAASDCSQEVKDTCGEYCAGTVTPACQGAYDALLTCLSSTASVSCACTPTPIFQGCDAELQAYGACEGFSGCGLVYSPDGTCGMHCPTWGADCKPEGAGYSCVCTSGPHVCKSFTFQMKCDQGTGWDDVVEANCAP